jgi:excisionase family DNA binding protein
MQNALEAERDRLKHENAYLLARFIETEVELRKVLSELRESFSGLQALEKIKLLKAPELAEYFQVSQDRVYELIRSHGLPAIELGRHQFRFDPVAVRRWLDTGGTQFLAEENGRSDSSLHEVES